MSRKEFLVTDIKIDGIKELAQFCKELPNRVLKKALSMAVNAGATPIARDARKNAPKLSGTLKKSIKKKVKVYGNGNAIAIIGADRSMTSPNKHRKTGLNVPAKYIHLIERGVKPHAEPNNRWYSKKPHPGFQGVWFLKDAVDKNAAGTKKIMEDKMQEVLLNEAVKLRDQGYKG